jgi:uncharacterized membrane protein
MKQIKALLIWAVGISFIVIGLLKYANLDEMSKAVLDRANYPHWFIYVIGAIELVGGILMLMTTNSSKRLGSILIGFVMLGAIATRYLLGEPYSHFVLPGAILLIAILTLVNPQWKGRPR